MFLPHRNHPEADQRGGTVVALLAVDADVVAGVEEAAAERDTPLIDHLCHVAVSRFSCRLSAPKPPPLRRLKGWSGLFFS